MPELNTEIADQIIDNALELFRLIANEKRDMAARLQSLEETLLAQLNGIDLTQAQQKRIDALFIRVANLINDAYLRAEQAQRLSNVAKVVGKHTVTALEIIYGKEAISKPKSEFYDKVASDIMIDGAPTADWWRGQAEDLKFKFKQQVRIGLINGETNQQIVQRIVGSENHPGIMSTARRNAFALVHNSIQTVANEARRTVYKNNSDVIVGIKQLSTLDGRTSDICIAYSGATWDLEGKPIRGNHLPYNNGVPRHWNCRSVEVPITKTFQELGLDLAEPPARKRASDEGPIDANITFDEFLKRKSKAYQDEMLGAGRAELWREGKITLKDLVDGQGRPLTLEELRGRVNDRKAGALFSPEYLDSLPDKSELRQPVNTWGKLENIGKQGLRQFNTAFIGIAEEMKLTTGLTPEQFTGDKLKDGKGYLFLAPLKSKSRAEEKVNSDYRGDWSKLTDMVRGTIAVDNMDQIGKAIDLMRRQGIDFAAKPKDKFAHPTPEGYRDLNGIVRLPNGMLAEIQFHLKPITAAKNEGRKYYEITRSLQAKYGGDAEPNAAWDEADKKAFDNAFKAQKDLYDKAWQAI